MRMILTAFLAVLSFTSITDAAAHLPAADMSSITSQAIEMLTDTSFRVTQIMVTNASSSLSGAVGGIYTDVAMGGTAIVAPTQTYSAIPTLDQCPDLSIVPTPGRTFWPAGTALYLNLTTPQSVATTAHFFVYGIS